MVNPHDIYTALIGNITKKYFTYQRLNAAESTQLH